MKNYPFDPDYHARQQAELAALTPAQRAARRQKQDAGSAQARLSLGCFCIWLSDGRYLLTGLPPMGDVIGTQTRLTLFTAEHRVTVEGRNLRWLAADLKRQRLDDLRVTAADAPMRWAVTSITAQARGEGE